jgi:NifB/MoaA-like Fe-S oxidoreductase
MPPGMRETLYFKDDDTRLSFLLGNYVTLTNLSEKDIEKIIRYRMEPINISFQTMNPELRCKMLNNRFAGEALKKADTLYEAGIEMNGQIVLCKSVNDGEELEYSLQKMYEYVPTLQSASVVPVGLSKFRDGLYPLEPFTKEDAEEVIDRIEQWQKKSFEEKGIHFIHASDEWYFLAGRPLPEEERYDGYLQLENGVGMVRNFVNEFSECYRKEFGFDPAFSELFDGNIPELQQINQSGQLKKRRITYATGELFAPVLKECIENLKVALPEIDLEVFAIRNDFFGERITVTGLITGIDLMTQLKDRNLGELLFIPDVMIRCFSDVFLDDIKVSEVETALHCPIDIVKSSGGDLILSLLEILNGKQDLDE